FHRVRKPVDAPEPAVAVGCIPADRPQDALLPPDLRLPARLVVQLLVADAERHHVGRAGAQALLVDDDAAVARPESSVGADGDDEVAPVAHRDVLALAVDVDVSGHAL